MEAFLTLAGSIGIFPTVSSIPASVVYGQLADNACKICLHWSKGTPIQIALAPGRYVWRRNASPAECRNTYWHKFHFGKSSILLKYVYEVVVGWRPP